MQQSFKHAARLFGTKASRVGSTGPLGRVSREVSPGTPWTCLDCRFKAQARGFRKLADGQYAARRTLSTSLRRRDEDGKSGIKQPINPNVGTTTNTNTGATSTETATDHSSLPSHVEKQRWQFSKDTTQLIDRLLSRASIAGQHINVYTGTDYSGIEALRKQITTQEETVRTAHRAVDDAKSNHHKTIADQASAQKEIVGLLERKSSWAPNDLERYMSLVRSEHLNDQSVQTAKDTLSAAERELEDARSLLERLERKQYHEEQIWSDTIRRNSTWLTFGLMGVNILLLLTQIAIFEPMRRRRIVRDVKDALDEKTIHKGPLGVVEEKDVTDEEALQQREVVVKPSSTLIDDVEASAKEPLVVSASQSTPDLTDVEVGEAALATGEVLPEEVVEITEASTTSATALKDAQTRWDAYQAAFYDLFSQRLVQLKQVELTTIALQSAATGAAAIGLLVLVFRPR